MEIPIRSVGKTSAVSGKAFAPGDRVWSFLCRSPEGFIDRVDILENERTEFQPEGTVLCKWSQLMKEPEVSGVEMRRAALQSADEVFLSLFETTATQDGCSVSTEESRDRLKYFLALQLERKRILKPLGSRRYRHVPSGREVTVPDLEITPELITAFQEEISRMGSSS